MFLWGIVLAYLLATTGGAEWVLWLIIAGYVVYYVTDNRQ